MTKKIWMENSGEGNQKAPKTSILTHIKRWAIGLSIAGTLGTCASRCMYYTFRPTEALETALNENTDQKIQCFSARIGGPTCSVNTAYYWSALFEDGTCKTFSACIDAGGYGMNKSLRKATSFRPVWKGFVQRWNQNEHCPCKDGEY